MRVPRETTIGRGVRIRKLRKGGVSCSRCSAAAKKGKTFARGCWSHSSEWKVKSFIGRGAKGNLTQRTQNTRRGRADRKLVAGFRKPALHEPKARWSSDIKRIKIY